MCLFWIIYYKNLKYPSGLIFFTWFYVKRESTPIWKLPLPPALSSHTYTNSTLSSSETSAYFITTFVQKSLIRNQTSNTFFFHPAVSHFMSRDISVPSLEGDSILACIDKMAQIFKLPHSHLLPNAIIRQYARGTFF